MSEPPFEFGEPDLQTGDESTPRVRSAPPQSTENDPLSYFHAVEERQLERRDDIDRRGRISRIRMVGRVTIAALVLVALVAVVARPAIIGRSGNPPEPTIVPSGVSYCEELETKDFRRLEIAIQTMKSVEPGAQLLTTLIENDVCLDLDDIPYNAAYFSWYEAGFRSDSTIYFIVIDRELLEDSLPDEVAALLVHEATHAHRWFNGLDCEQRRSCTYLANEIRLEEEIAAHRAEAQWWMALHGATGTNSGGSYKGTTMSAYLNRLLYYYLKGPTAFEEYVRAIRSGSQEGEGIEPPPFLEQQSD